MKIWIIVAIGLVLGVAAGMGDTWREFAGVQERFPLPDAAGGVGLPVSPDSETMKRGKVVVVNGESHDFGVMENNTKHRHNFIFKNEGDAPITLTKGETSCGKCTISELEKTELQPGESGKATIEWSIESGDAELRQSANIYVAGDPLRKMVQLTVHGLVRQSIRVEPGDIAFSSLSANVSQTGAVRIFAFHTDDLQIVNYKLANPETSGSFDVNIQPLSPDELKKESGARSGLEVQVTAKTGLPLGPINQTIRLVTNYEPVGTLEIPVHGVVVSDISFVGGQNFVKDVNLLRLGLIKSSTGAKVNLHMLVKGPEPDKVTVELGAIDPDDVLTATIGERISINKGAAFMYPVTIEVKPGSRAINRLGVKSGDAGRIMINTTHPQAKQVQLLVQFAVDAVQ
jgi:hypothetical protein